MASVPMANVLMAGTSPTASPAPHGVSRSMAQT
jgi:hypothetical protein